MTTGDAAAGTNRRQNSLREAEGLRKERWETGLIYFSIFFILLDNALKHLLAINTFTVFRSSTEQKKKNTQNTVFFFCTSFIFSLKKTKS